jgi:hypothetical protein
MHAAISWFDSLPQQISKLFDWTDRILIPFCEPISDTSDSFQWACTIVYMTEKRVVYHSSVYSHDNYRLFTKVALNFNLTLSETRGTELL